VKQAILFAPLDLRVEDVDVPALEPGDCLIRVESALVCGTDIRIYEGTKKNNVDYPSVLGHEFCGEIVDASGPLPSGLELGDRVAVYPLVPCGECAACVRGRENICRERVAFGYQLPGGFAEFVRVPAIAVSAGNLVKVNGIDAGSGALIEPLACAYNGQKLIDAANAEALLVVGCGPLGIMHIRLARALGARRIVAVDPSNERRAIADASGADLTLTPSGETATQIREFTGGTGVDAMVVAVGRPDAVEPYLSALAPGAKVNVFAGFPTGGDSITISANDIHYNEYSIVGSSSSHLSDFQHVASLVINGTLQVADLVTRTMNVEDTADAIMAAKAGSELRIAIDANR
jgi:L-iditol 2-dehydrogenase